MPVLDDERGASAVEFALLLPFVLLLFLGILQFGSIYFLKNSMLDVGGEIARRFVIGEIADEVEATALARSRLTLLGADVDVRIRPIPGTTDLIEVVLGAPMRKAAIIDPFQIFGDSRFEARVVWRTFAGAAPS